MVLTVAFYKTNNFLSIINKDDIFALAETHATYETEMNSNILPSEGINWEADLPGAIRIYKSKTR